MVNGSGQSVGSGSERIQALDGLRGLMALFVLVAHYFGEVENGVRGLAIGWVAVVMFFVLSGFVVGRQILATTLTPGFLRAFFVRRLCRSLPVYVVTVLAAFGLLALFQGSPWLAGSHAIPLWSYLTFSQNFAMVTLGDPGVRWLAPTWTLTVEQQFYLLAPLLFLIVPRRYLLTGLLLGAGASVVFRGAILGSTDAPAIASLVLLPASTDALLLGLAAAVVVRQNRLRGLHWVLALRIAAPLALFAACGLRLIGGEEGTIFAIWGPTLVAIGCAAFLLAIVRGAPEAQRMQSPFLRFTGRISYSLYLTHLTVLALMHGVLLAAPPDIGTGVELAVTLAAVPVAILAGWLLTALVEQPVTALGRRWAGHDGYTPSMPQPATA